MTIFEAVKSMVTPRMAAEHYGMTISRSGMVCCPFHDDRHPSMKLQDAEHYLKALRQLPLRHSMPLREQISLTRTDSEQQIHFHWTKAPI